MMKSSKRTTTKPPDDRSRAVRWAASVCIVLLGFLLFVQTAHVHPAGSNPDQCPICVAMHSAAPTQASSAVLTMTWRSDLVVAATDASPCFALHCTLYNRPPPGIA